jgi:hypothetical protein
MTETKIAPYCISPRKVEQLVRLWQSERVAMINPKIFILMVIIGASPPQQRGKFHSYHHCYEAAQGEIANLGPDVRWDCVLKYRHGEQE